MKKSQKESSWNEWRHQYAYGQKDDSSPQKITLRHKMVKLLNAPAIHLLDAYCGEGQLYQKFWKANVASYLGLDNEKVHTLAPTEKVDDNRLWVQKNDVAAYNFFDLDAYAFPWEMLYLVCRHKTFMQTHKRVGFTLTDGGLILNKMSGANRVQQAVLRIPSKMKIPALHRHLKFMLAMMVKRAAKEAGATAGAIQYTLTKAPSNTVYLGFILSK